VIPNPTPIFYVISLLALCGWLLFYLEYRYGAVSDSP